MANSSFIGKAKNKLIKEFIKDESIVKAIGSSITSPEKLVGTHIFNYHQNPNTLTTVDTFITVQVHIPKSFYGDTVFVKPTIEIWIISHYEHMRVDNIPKIKSNRNDYLSMLIDKELNGKNYGYGGLTLTLNIEGSFQSDYAYRKLCFATTDLNRSLCEEDV